MSLLENLLRRPRRRPRPPRPETIISKQIGKAIAGLIIAGGAALFGLQQKNTSPSKKQIETPQAQVEVLAQSPHFQIEKAIAENRQAPFVEVKSAKVIKLLRNDNKGARHQRWIIQTSNGSTVTVVHNIDLAEKVPLSAGDEIDVAGELVFGDRKKDPILHWTHADPQKKRIGGYVVHLGKKYGDLIQ